jgi:hypothetical protein
MQKAVFWMAAGAALVVACSGEPSNPLPLPTGSGSGGSGNTGNTSSPGSGGEGGEPAPVFELPCGGDSCEQGGACCDAAGEMPTCVADPAACLGTAYPCNDAMDCAGAGEPQVCCAFYDVTMIDPVLQQVVCINKGGCSGMGAVRLCADTMDCEECTAGVGMPDGFQTCGPP